MSDAEKALKHGRDTAGRFLPGSTFSQVGSRNKVTRLLEQMLHGDAERIQSKVMELAMEGDVPCLLALYSRIFPLPKGVTARVNLPLVHSPQTTVLAIAQVIEQFATGDLDSAGADAAVRLLVEYRKALTEVELEERIARLELTTLENKS